MSQRATFFFFLSRHPKKNAVGGGERGGWNVHEGFSFWANSCHLVNVEKRLSALRRVTDVNSEPHGSLVRLQTNAGALHVHVIM